MRMVQSVSSFILVVGFLLIICSLRTKIKALRHSYMELLSESVAMDHLSIQLQQKLEASTEVETIKWFRKKTGLSILQAKQIVDLAKQKNQA